MARNRKKLEIIIEAVNRTDRGVGRAIERVAKLGLAAGAAGVASATAMALMIRRTAQAIDEQTKWADRLGVSTEALGAYEFAASKAGVKQNDLRLGWQRMARRVAQAAREEGEAVGALEELRLSAEELAQLAPDEQFRRIAAAMADVASQNDRIRLAQKIFDSEGVALVNLMNEGVARNVELAERLGLTLDRVDSAQVERMNDAFTDARAVLSGVFRQLTASVSPAISVAVELVRDWALEMNAAGRIGAAAAAAIEGGWSIVATAVEHARSVVLTMQLAVLDLEVAMLGVADNLDRRFTDLQNIVAGLTERSRLERALDFAQEAVDEQVRVRRESGGKNVFSAMFEDVTLAFGALIEGASRSGASEGRTAAAAAREEQRELQREAARMAIEQTLALIEANEGSGARASEAFAEILEGLRREAEAAAAEAEGRARSERNLLLGGDRGGDGRGEFSSPGLVSSRFLQGAVENPLVAAATRQVDLQTTQVREMSAIRGLVGGIGDRLDRLARAVESSSGSGYRVGVGLTGVPG